MFFEPLDIFFDTVRDGCLGRVTEQVVRLVDIGVGAWDVSGLVADDFNLSSHSAGFFDHLDQFGEGGGGRPTEVENFEVRLVIVGSGQNAIHDVLDVGVVAGGGAVSVLLDGFASEDALGEFGNSEVRALTWSVDREKAQTHATDAEEVGVV